MRDYTNLDLALAVTNCRNLVELETLARTVRYIYLLGEYINIEFFFRVAIKREQVLKEQFRKNNDI